MRNGGWILAAQPQRPICSHRLCTLGLTDPCPIPFWIRALVVSKSARPVHILALCLGFLVPAPSEWLGQGGPGSRVLSLSSAAGGGGASFLILLEAPQGHVLPEYHCDGEWGQSVA